MTTWTFSRPAFLICLAFNPLTPKIYTTEGIKTIIIITEKWNSDKT